MGEKWSISCVISISQPSQGCLKDVFSSDADICFMFCIVFVKFMVHSMTFSWLWNRRKCFFRNSSLNYFWKAVDCLNWLSCKAFNLQLWFARFLLFCGFFPRNYMANDCFFTAYSFYFCCTSFVSFLSCLFLKKIYDSQPCRRITRFIDT